MTATRLVLVRHGESRATADQVVGGHEGCRGLTEKGRRQAEALRDRLLASEELRPDVLLTSVLPRAIETAEIIAPAFGGLEAVRDCDLCELHPGESDGLSWTEYQARYNVDMFADPRAPIAPGGESLADFHERVNRTLRRVADEHEGCTVAIVCHGGIVASSFLAFFGLPLDRPSAAEVWVENAALTEWALSTHGRWRLVRHNDDAHLATVAP